MRKIPVFGAAALLALAACLTQAGTPPVYLPPEPGERRLANIRQLTFGGQNAEAYFSRDGRRITFQATPEEGGARCDQQYVMNADGSGLLRISNGLGKTTCGFFHDRDRRILFSSTHASSPECPPAPDMSQGYTWGLDDYDIYSVRTDGTGLVRLTDSPGYDAEATVSPDGRTIVFTSERNGDLDIYTMNADGSNVRRLTHEVGYDGGAFFSPDGTKIVYRAWHPRAEEEIAEHRRLLSRHLVRPSRMEIWVMDADGSDRRRVTDLGGANFAPYFTPDGRRIIFSSNHTNPRSRRFDLYLVNLDGTGLEQVTAHEDFDGFPMFSPDGTKLLWASNRNGRVPGETNLFIADWRP